MSAYDFYDVMIEKWIEREQPWAEADALREFSERLAVDLHRHREARGTERIHYRDLKPLAEEWGITLEDWKLRGRSLLNNDAEGNYKFAHRSIMEFLALKQFIRPEVDTQGVILTDQMQFFLKGMEVQGIDLSGSNLEGAHLEDANLKGANLKGANLKGANLERANLEDVNLEETDLQGACYNSSTTWPEGFDYQSSVAFGPNVGLLEEWTNSTGMVFVRIPAGFFLMGSPELDAEASDPEKPAHRVEITQPFYLGKYPVTQGQWEAVIGENPSRFKGELNRPVEQVSWEDVQRFMGTLNERDGVSSYRLPTEAQWEYACRAGTESRRYHEDIGSIAWYDENSSGAPQVVGQKLPNAWGLYDMLGNVVEWVEDWHGGYTVDSVTDPSGPEAGANRVIRGGSWDDSARLARSASRYWYRPGYRSGYLGFRCLMFRT